MVRLTGAGTGMGLYPSRHSLSISIFSVSVFLLDQSGNLHATKMTAMRNTFKKMIEGRDYVFYRTTPEEGVTYFVMYSFDDQRYSVRIPMDKNGTWYIESGLITEFQDDEVELIYAILDNEQKKYS